MAVQLGVQLPGGCGAEAMADRLLLDLLAAGGTHPARGGGGSDMIRRGIARRVARGQVQYEASVLLPVKWKVRSQPDRQPEAIGVAVVSGVVGTTVGVAGDVSLVVGDVLEQ